MNLYEVVVTKVVKAGEAVVNREILKDVKVYASNEEAARMDVIRTIDENIKTEDLDIQSRPFLR